MGDMEEERSILEALDPGQREEVSAEEAHSILLDINHIREHIETLEDAARAARAVEFDQIRVVVEQLESVAAAARSIGGISVAGETRSTPSSSTKHPWAGLRAGASRTTAGTTSRSR